VKKKNIRLAILFVLGVCAVVLGWAMTRPQMQPFVQEPGQLEYAIQIGWPLEVTNSMGVVMRLIPPGEYLRGSPVSERNRRVHERQHRVTIPHTIYMAATETTQAQFVELMGVNPSAVKQAGREQVPVDSVTFEQALIFCNRLSAREGFDPVYEQTPEGWVAFHERNGYRLPLESEWEYAARATTTTEFYTGSMEARSKARENIWRAAWYYSNSKGRPQNVGRREPNGWGLFDMLGNVWEYCWDWYGDYPLTTEFDLRGPTRSNRGRVLRGGCWYDKMPALRVANRRYHRPDWPLNVLGFRVVRTVIPPESWLINTATTPTR